MADYGEDSRHVFQSLLEINLARLGLRLTNKQIATLWKHFQAVCEANRRMNLTRITDPAEAAVLHYADSLALAAWMEHAQPAGATVLDIGTGAGFPAVPLAVARPDLKITAMDGTRKKALFVEQAARELDLKNLSAQHAHGAHWSGRKRFGAVTARAVACLGELLPQAAALLEEGGSFAAFKADPLAEREQAAERKALARLPLALQAPFPYALLLEEENILRQLRIYRRLPV